MPAQRFNVASWNGRVKSCNYLNNVIAKMEAKAAGVVEALMLDRNGYVVECTADNIFIVKNGVVFTPPCFLGALKGITRDAIIEIAREVGLEVKEEIFTRFEVYAADEVFLTGTAAEAIPVVKVDQRAIGSGRPGPVTRRLVEEFRRRVTADGTHVDY